MGNNPSSHKGDGVLKTSGDLLDPSRPVENMSRNQVREFLQKLNSMDEKYFYRLPTSAEWEYAARGNKNTYFSFGDDEREAHKYMWSDKNSQGRTQQVMRLTPNDFGLYDVQGNVFELVDRNVLEETPSGNVLTPRYSLRSTDWLTSPAAISRETPISLLSGNYPLSRVGLRLVRTRK